MESLFDERVCLTLMCVRDQRLRQSLLILISCVFIQNEDHEKKSERAKNRDGYIMEASVSVCVGEVRCGGGALRVLFLLLPLTSSIQHRHRGMLRV